MLFKLGQLQITIWLLLLVTFAKGVVWSIVIPPWHAPDENNHFEYAQIIERFGTLHPDPGFWQLSEIAVSWEVAQMRSVRFSPKRILDLADRRGIAEVISRLDDPAIKRGYTYDDGRWFYSFRSFTYGHAPLYYVLAGAIQASLEDKSILIRILANRWLSVFLGVVTVALAYRVGKEIWQNEGWACFLATLVSFQPMLTFITAVIGDGALGIAMLSACTVVMLRVSREGWTLRRASVLAILVGLSLLARASLVILFPLLILSFLWNVRRDVPRPRFNPSVLARVALMLLLPVLIAGWWYKSSGFDFSDTPISVLFSRTLRVATEGARFATNYDWFDAYRNTLGWYWGNFGWLDTPLPERLHMLLTGITVVAVWTALWWLIKRVLSSEQPRESIRTYMIFMLGIQTIFLVILYTYLDIHFLNIGEIYSPQGRFFLPPIIGQMTWLAIGLVSPAPARLRRVWMWLIAVGMVALNIYALFSVITLRYYGARNLLLVADRAAVLQPISSNSILILCAFFFLLVGGFVFALWRTLENRLTRSEELFNRTDKPD